MKNSLPIKSLKHTINEFRRNDHVKNEVLWYPHCGNDMDFLRSMLSIDKISPRIFILNDNMNNNCSVDWDDQVFNIIERQVISFSETMFAEDNATIEFYHLEIAPRKRVYVIRMLGVSSENLLEYFLENRIIIDIIFTSRMAGGIFLSHNGEQLDLTSETVRKKLNYKYLITDLHRIRNGAPIIFDVVDDKNIDEACNELKSLDFLYLNSIKNRPSGNREHMSLVLFNNLHD